MTVTPYTPMKPLPLRGGMVTDLDAAQLTPGSFSAAVNVRPEHPGFINRPGQKKQHSTADSTNQVKTLYQFIKNEIVETHLFAQMSDGDILEAATAPPGVTTGEFGSEVFSGSAGQKSAAWASCADLLIHTNGVDPPKVYAGTDNYPSRVVAYTGTDTPADNEIIDNGLDYTEEATDGDAATVVILDALGTDADQAVYICCPVRANRLTFTVSAANGNAVASTLNYKKSNGTWSTASVIDATEVMTLDTAPGTTWAVGDTITGVTSEETSVIVEKLTDLTYRVTSRTGDYTDGEVLTNGTYTADQGAGYPVLATLGSSGSMYWAPPSDEIPWFMFGMSGFWYRLNFDAALDAEVEVSKITYGTDHDASGDRTTFLTLENVWDGIAVDAVEAQVNDTLPAGTYLTFGTGSINVGGITFDENDKLYISSFDPLAGIYVDPGDTPNTDSDSDAALAAVKYWTGTAWSALGSPFDGTDGLTQAGWITWDRPTGEHKQMFKGTQYYAYWYEITLDDAISTDVILSIQTMPYFKLSEMGKGVACCTWTNRVATAYDRYGQYILMSAKDKPSVLNGADYGVLEAGDGRSNQVLSMSQFSRLWQWK